MLSILNRSQCSRAERNAKSLIDVLFPQQLNISEIQRFLPACLNLGYHTCIVRQHEEVIPERCKLSPLWDDLFYGAPYTFCSWIQC